MRCHGDIFSTCSDRFYTCVITYMCDRMGFTLEFKRHSNLYLKNNIFTCEFHVAYQYYKNSFYSYIFLLQANNSLFVSNFSAQDFQGNNTKLISKQDIKTSFSLKHITLIKLVAGFYQLVRDATFFLKSTIFRELAYFLHPNDGKRK